MCIYHTLALEPSIAVAPAAARPSPIAAAVRHLSIYQCILYVYIYMCVYMYLIMYIYRAPALQPRVAIAPAVARPSPIAAAVRTLYIYQCILCVYIYVYTCI